MSYYNRIESTRIPAPRRVVVTGLGAVSASGIGANALWRALLEGESGIKPITRFDASGMDSRIAGEVADFDPLTLIDTRLKPKRLSRQTQFAVVAAAEAMRDAGFEARDLRHQRVGIVIGSAICGLEAVTESALKMHQKGVDYGNPSIVPIGNLQASALAVAEFLEVEEAYAMGISNACVSGLDAVKAAGDLIRSGRFDVVFCGGTDAPISKTPWAEFTLGGLNTTRNAEPARAVRPFDRERETGLLGEGAGVLVVENREVAMKRGARPYMEILGDYTCVDPDKERPGSGLEWSMKGALENARCDLREIDHISAWGCGHPVMDRAETLAIKAVFGRRAYEIAVGSIKGVIGSPLAAAGPLQLVALGLSYKHGLLPATTNCEHPDVDCDLDYICEGNRRMSLRKALLNAHGLGGSNTSMVVAQP